jgi:hypothetical protein
MSGERKQGSRLKRALLSLVVLASLAVALQSVVFSGADFTAASTDPGNSFTAGDLAHTNSGDGQVVIDAAGMVPGASKSTTLTLTGSGDLTGAYTLSESGVADTPASPGLSGVLVLTVEDVTGTPATLFQGTVSAFSAVGLGSIGPGETRTYRLTLAYPAGPNDAALQGATMTLGLDVTGVSS